MHASVKFELNCTVHTYIHTYILTYKGDLRIVPHLLHNYLSIANVHDNYCNSWYQTLSIKQIIVTTVAIYGVQKLANV